MRIATPHLLLALLLVAVWGTNFVVIRVALWQMPPLLFGALRFTFAAVPAAFLIKRPKVRWRNLAAYGLLVGVCQFGFLFVAMRHDISPGLASLVMQMQVFMTVGLCVVLYREPLHWFQVVAMALAALGLALIAYSAHGDATPLGLVLALLAAASWAGSNLIVKHSGATDMLAYIVWSSLFSAPALIGLTLLTDGWDSTRIVVESAGAAAWLAIAWQSVGNTLFGYSAWAWLLGRYPAATITPVALLIPVFGMGASALLLGEPLPVWKITAAGLVVAGLAINVVWPRWSATLEARRAAASA